jgi:hypothetical protein
MIVIASSLHRCTPSANLSINDSIRINRKARIALCFFIIHTRQRFVGTVEKPSFASISASVIAVQPRLLLRKGHATQPFLVSVQCDWWLQHFA